MSIRTIYIAGASLCLLILLYLVGQLGDRRALVDSQKNDSISGHPEEEAPDPIYVSQSGLRDRSAIDSAEARLSSSLGDVVEIADVESEYLISHSDVAQDLGVVRELVEEGEFRDVMESAFDMPGTQEFLEALKRILPVRRESRTEAVSAASSSVFLSGWSSPLNGLDLDPAVHVQAEMVILDFEARKLELMMEWTEGDITQQQLDSALGDLRPVWSRLDTVLSPSELDHLMSARNEVIDNMDYSPEFTQLQKESESGSLFPLFYSREYELIEARLDAGADPNQLREGRPDDSLLSVAVSIEAEAVAMALISRGANVNFADSQGKTALHHAAVSGSAELIAALLEAGADPEAKTRTGFTPAMLARIAWVFEEEERPDQVHSLLSNQTQ